MAARCTSMGGIQRQARRCPSKTSHARWGAVCMRYAVRRVRMLTIVLLGATVLLAGCGAEASVAPTDTAHPNATSTPIPTVLYQADWSSGADGWTLPAHWS